MDNNNVELVKQTFKLAYKLGKEDSLNGVHICLDTLFEHLVDTTVIDLNYIASLKFEENNQPLKPVC